MESTYFTFNVDWKTLNQPLENSIVTETKKQLDVVSEYLNRIIGEDELFYITPSDIEDTFSQFRKCCYCSIKGTFSECLSEIPVLLKDTLATTKPITQNSISFLVSLIVAENRLMTEVQTLVDAVDQLIPSNILHDRSVIQILSTEATYNENDIIKLEILFGNIYE